jgi:hypothetical protein
MEHSDLTPTVTAIGKMDFQGNITPPTWYQTITFDNGKADLVAITILAEVVYWYRPAVIRDEATGEVVGWRKKFKADKLQRTYQSLAEQFGISKRQVREACRRLREQGLLTLELRTVVARDGTRMNNVLYLEPVPEKLAAVTYPPMTSQRHTYDVRMSQVWHPNVIPMTSQCQTNTEITTENTTENMADAAISELTAFGVDGPMARRLAQRCPASQVRGWVAYARQARGLDNPAGFVVARLSAGEPVPAGRGPGQEAGGEQSDRKRYIQGQFAEYIQH